MPVDILRAVATRTAGLAGTRQHFLPAMFPEVQSLSSTPLEVRPVLRQECPPAHVTAAGGDMLAGVTGRRR
jgi:hypothetical protein